MSSADEWAAWIARKLEAAGEGPAGTGQQPRSVAGTGQQPSVARPAYDERQGNAEHQPAADTLAPPHEYRPFPQRQGNGKHGGDEASPRKPGDPPWRSRTARRTSTPEAMRAFREARQRRGWSLTRAAEETGVSRPHLSLLERGLRRPSESVAEDIITAYRMTELEAEALRAIAVPWAGRDSPYRTGEAPGEEWWP